MEPLGFGGGGEQWLKEQIFYCNNLITMESLKFKEVVAPLALPLLPPMEKQCFITKTT